MRKTDKEKEDNGAKRAKIRALNDAFRTTFRGGRVMMTTGVNTLADAARERSFRRSGISMPSTTSVTPGITMVSSASSMMGKRSLRK